MVFEPVPPVFAVSDDVAAFDSVEEMLAYIEPVDVTPTLKSFDAQGKRIVVKSEVTSTRLHPRRERTLVDLDASGDDAADELATVLRRYLGRVGVDHLGWTSDQLRNAPLPDLVAQAAKWAALRRAAREVPIPPLHVRHRAPW